MNNLIGIVAQAFYGNRTFTRIDPADFDRFLQGILNDDLPLDYEVDRTIIELPNTDGIVVIYNKYQEEEIRSHRHFDKFKPLCIIPEKDVTIYSRCIACRLDENGEPAGINEGDYEKITKYFVE